MSMTLWRQVAGWSWAYHDGRLSLWVPEGRETPLAVDFSQGKQGYRLDPNGCAMSD